MVADAPPQKKKGEGGKKENKVYTFTIVEELCCM